jgi:hypothetical protein
MYTVYIDISKMLFTGKGSSRADAISTRALGQNFNGDAPHVDFRQANTRHTVLESQCPSVPQCFNSKYRKIDGSCNHNRDSKYGKAETPLQRILEPAYSDGKPNFKFPIHVFESESLLYLLD